MFRTLLTGSAGLGGAAYTSSSPVVDPATQRFMQRIIENTPLDPATLDYANAGMSPIWAFATIVTMGMGPHFAAASRRWMEDRSSDRSRRLEAELTGRVELGPDEVSNRDR